MRLWAFYMCLILLSVCFEQMLVKGAFNLQINNIFRVYIIQYNHNRALTIFLT